MSTAISSNIIRRKMTIKLRNQYGSVITGRSVAARLRHEIEAETHRGHDVWIDFDGIVAISPSAGDEIFAKLDRSGPGQAHFENVPSSIEALARFVVANRTGQA